MDDIREGVAAVMREVGAHPSHVYAFLKTGLLVGEDSPHTDAQRQEWIDAVNEWYDGHTVEAKGGE